MHANVAVATVLVVFAVVSFDRRRRCCRFGCCFPSLVRVVVVVVVVVVVGDSQVLCGSSN